MIETGAQSSYCPKLLRPFQDLYTPDNGFMTLISRYYTSQPSTFSSIILYLLALSIVCALVDYIGRISKPYMQYYKKDLFSLYLPLPNILSIIAPVPRCRLKWYTEFTELTDTTY